LLRDVVAVNVECQRISFVPQPHRDLCRVNLRGELERRDPIATATHLRAKGYVVVAVSGGSGSDENPVGMRQHISVAYHAGRRRRPRMSQLLRDKDWAAAAQAIALVSLRRGHPRRNLL
jgi:hypothetical protein